MYELDPLHPGAQVWIPDLRRYGKMLQPANQFRSYIEATGTRDVRRNGKQLVSVRETEADERMRRPAQGKSMGMGLESHGMHQAVGMRAESHQLQQPVEEKQVFRQPVSEETAAQRRSPTPQGPHTPGSPQELFRGFPNVEIPGLGGATTCYKIRSGRQVSMLCTFREVGRTGRELWSIALRIDSRQIVVVQMFNNIT
ncbi:hypothetical protein PR048_014424 [Dryococelus australis]|uniref:Uncharacterized protein n=1 Tax=Dryococelus australis TaxID=614101 RepID=A0ABQ9HE77_9NEOP|nr:hypothetical protein PR048_014424 [Dryococelus australis]